MKMTFKAYDPLHKTKIDAVVFMFSDDSPGLKNRPALKELEPFLSPLLASGELKTSYLSMLPFKLSKEQGGRWIFLVGLGDRGQLTAARILDGAAKAAKTASDFNCKSLFMDLPEISPFTAEHVLELLALGANLGLYAQKDFKSVPPAPSPLKALTLAGGPEAQLTKREKQILEEVDITAKYIALARDLGNQPGNVCTPESLAQRAKTIGQALKMKVTVWDETAAAKEKLGLFLAVGQGSVNKPRMVTMVYRGGPKDQKPTVLVGKGVTFDSGGLCLKNADGMSAMKTDMSGAGDVLAIIAAAAEMKIPKNLVAIMPLVENMPSGSAYRPGDVLVSRSGQTVEVINTDAEGRLILADALTLAGEHKPGMIIDMATLTGACVIALGENCAAVFSNNEKAMHKIVETGTALGENFWPLPFLDEYEDGLKSETADFAHIATQKGGTINAALFLRKFVDQETPWLHLDIAGPSRAPKASPSAQIGSTGFGVRTVLKFLQNS